MGPGLYKPENLSIGVARVVKTPVLRSESFVKGLPLTGYYISGQSLKFDEEILPRKQPGKSRNKGTNSLYGRAESLSSLFSTDSVHKKCPSASKLSN